MKIIFLLLLLSFQSYAQNISISYTKSNDLLLTGSNCEELLKQQAAICEWKRSLNETNGVVNKCQKSGKKFQLKISGCLPGFVKTYQNKKQVYSGANCWGTALSFKKHSLLPRFVWSQEMKYWLDSPLCRVLDVGEKKQAGDIITIFSPEYLFSSQDWSRGRGRSFWDKLYPGRYQLPLSNDGYSGFHTLLHSETYISDQLSFGKDSPFSGDRYKFQNLINMYGRSRDERCQEAQELRPHLREYANEPRSIARSHCDYFSLAYRCQNFEEYFKRQALNESERAIWEEVNYLNSLQKSLFKLGFAGTLISDAGKDQILKISASYSKEALHQMTLNLGNNFEMLAVLKYFSAEALVKAFEQAELIEATEPL